MPGSEEPVFRFLTCHGLAFAQSTARLGGKIPERREDDFFPANQPVRAALHMTGQKAIFARKKLEYPFAGIAVGRKLPSEIKKRGNRRRSLPLSCRSVSVGRCRPRVRFQKTRKLRMHRMMANATRIQAIR